MNKSVKAIPDEIIERRICVIRGQKVMLDYDLAELYGVPTKALNQAVGRNKDRFPEDFMFKLSSEEMGAVNQSQTVTGSQKHRDPRYPAMASHKELARRIHEIEQKYDVRFKAVSDPLGKLMESPPVPPKRPIGYIHND